MKNVILRAAAILATMLICIAMIPAIVRADGPEIDTGIHTQLDFIPCISNYEELLEALPQVEHLEPTGNIIFVPVAQMDADIMIGEGQRIDTPGSIATEGFTLTIENGGYVKSSFFNNPGGQIIIKAGGELHVSGGEYCNNLGTIIVEPGGHLQCEKGEYIMNEPEGSMVLDGVYCVGSYIDENPDQQDIHEWFYNQGAVSGSGYAAAMPVESETGYMPPEKTLIAANKIRAQLGTDSIRVLAAAGSSEDFAAMSQMDDIDGFYLQSSDSGKYYLPTNPSREGYTFDSWTISSPLKDTDAWTSEMEEAFASISAKEDTSGTYVEAAGMFPLIIIPEWTTIIQASKSSQDGEYVGGATTLQSGPANLRTPKTYFLNLNEENYPSVDYMQSIGILYPGDKLQIIAETDPNPGGDGNHKNPGLILMDENKEWLDLSEGEKTGPLRVTGSVTLGELVSHTYVTEITVEDAPVIFNYKGKSNAQKNKYAVQYESEAGVHDASYWPASTIVWVGVPKYHPVEYTYVNDIGNGNSEDITDLPDKIFAGDNPAVIYAEDLSCSYNPIDGKTDIGPVFTVHHPKIKGYRFEDVEPIMETAQDKNYKSTCSDFSADRMTSQWRFFFNDAQNYNLTFDNKIHGSEENPIKIRYKYQEARTVSLNANGGTVDNVEESINVYKYRIDRRDVWYNDKGPTAFDFAQHTPIRSGYEFTGWYADEACTKLVIAADSGNMNNDFKTYINDNNIFQKSGSENCSENFDMYAGWKMEGAADPTPTPKPTATPTPKPTATPTPKPTATPTPKPASGFSDVQNPKHPYYNAIYWAANAGITKGYSDGTFGINKNCTRGEMMMFLWRYANKPSPKNVSKSPFKDVPKTHAFYKAILWGSQKGITKGYSDGTFGINRNVTRGECMMFLWRLKNKPAPKAVAKAPFPDVPKNHVFYNAVLWGFQKKITTGFTDGKLKGQFGVNENCTRGQIVTFLYRAR